MSGLLPLAPVSGNYTGRSLAWAHDRLGLEGHTGYASCNAFARVNRLTWRAKGEYAPRDVVIYTSPTAGPWGDAGIVISILPLRVLRLDDHGHEYVASGERAALGIYAVLPWPEGEPDERPA